MFRPMRRTAQQLPACEAEAILRTSTCGVLALLGDEDYPYAVPLNHYYTPGHLYFHGAVAGHKADAIRSHDKASFCVIAQDAVDAPTLSTRYQSVIVFGKIRIVEDAQEKREAILALARHFAPEYMEQAKAETDESWDHLCLFALDIEHITGKEAKSLMQQRREQQ